MGGLIVLKFKEVDFFVYVVKVILYNKSLLRIKTIPGGTAGIFDVKRAHLISCTQIV